MTKYNLQHTLMGHRGPINLVQISEDGAFLASGGQFISTLRQNNLPLLFFIADDGYIILWCLSNGAHLQKISPKQGPVVALQWLSYSYVLHTHLFISGGADGTVKLWKKQKEEVQLSAVKFLTLFYLLIIWLYPR
jgi:WD40 repeat protein